MHSDIHNAEIVFLLLLLFVVVFGVLSKKLKTPYPIVMVVGGLLLSLVPRVPDVQLNPDLVFFVILPPLLYSAAWLTSWREFSYNLVSILFLAFGLVTFTVLGVTALGNFFLPGFDWRVGLVLALQSRPLMPLPLPLLQNALDFPNVWWTFWRARACSTMPALCSHSNSAWCCLSAG